MSFPLLVIGQSKPLPKDASDYIFGLIMEQMVNHNKLKESAKGTYFIRAEASPSDVLRSKQFETYLYFKVSNDKNLLCAIRPVVKTDGTFTDSIDVGISFEQYWELDSIYTGRIKKERAKIPNDNTFYEVIDIDRFSIWIVDRIKLNAIMENGIVIASLQDYEFN